MPYVRKKPTISGNAIVDSSLEARHIQATTITADKFSGAVQEQYFSYDDDVDISFSYSTYYTVHEWFFPRTQLELFKGRHVSYSAEGYMNTATSTEYAAKAYFRLEAEVPDVQTATFIGTATYESATSGYQTVTLDGYVPLNRIGSGGSIGTLSGNYRTYKNLSYDPRYSLGSELITNGNFNSGTANWTLGDGSHSSGMGQYSLNTTSSSTFTPFSYQAVNTVIGKRYKVQFTLLTGNLSGIVYASTTADLDLNTKLADSGAKSTQATYDFEFIATTTTTYIILATSAGTSSGQYRLFDNISCKVYNDKTKLEISTTGGTIVPSGSPTNIYFHPYSGATIGTWHIVDTNIVMYRTTPYTNYIRVNAEAYLGWFADDIKLRLRCLNNGPFGKTLTINDLKIFMESRIVE